MLCAGGMIHMPRLCSSGARHTIHLGAVYIISMNLEPDSIKLQHHHTWYERYPTTGTSCGTGEKVASPAKIYVNWYYM